MLHGLLALVGAAAIAMMAMLLFWIVASGGSGSASDAVRSGVLVVLAACHGGLRIDGAQVGFVPLGLSLLVAMPCWRAGLALGASTPSGLPVLSRARLLGLAAAAFGLSAGVLAFVVRVGPVQARPIPTALGGALLFGLCAVGPFARATARERHPLEGPSITWVIVRAACAGLAVLVAAAALVGGGALAMDAGTARTLSEQVGGSGLGGLPLAVLGALCVPNAVVAAMAYNAGPGFAIGAGSTVSASGAAVGAVPAFPLLAAMPADHGAPAPVVALMIAAPVVAGLVVVRFLWLRLPYRRPMALVLGAAGAALLCGIAASILAALAGGSLGAGRLRDVGPPVLLTGGAVGAEVGAAALLGVLVLVLRSALAGRAPRRRRRRVSGTVRPSHVSAESPAEPDTAADTQLDASADSDADTDADPDVVGDVGAVEAMDTVEAVDAASRAGKQARDR